MCIYLYIVIYIYEISPLYMEHQPQIRFVGTACLGCSLPSRRWQLKRCTTGATGSPPASDDMPLERQLWSFDVDPTWGFIMNWLIIEFDWE